MANPKKINISDDDFSDLSLDSVVQGILADAYYSRIELPADIKRQAGVGDHVRFFGDFAKGAKTVEQITDVLEQLRGKYPSLQPLERIIDVPALRREQESPNVPGSSSKPSTPDAGGIVTPPPKASPGDPGSAVPPPPTPTATQPPTSPRPGQSGPDMPPVVRKPPGQDDAEVPPVVRKPPGIKDAADELDDLTDAINKLAKESKGAAKDIDNATGELGKGGGELPTPPKAGDEPPPAPPGPPGPPGPYKSPPGIDDFWKKHFEDIGGELAPPGATGGTSGGKGVGPGGKSTTPPPSPFGRGGSAGIGGSGGRGRGPMPSAAPPPPPPGGRGPRKRGRSTPPPPGRNRRRGQGVSGGSGRGGNRPPRGNNMGHFARGTRTGVKLGQGKLAAVPGLTSLATKAGAAGLALGAVAGVAIGAAKAVSTLTSAVDNAADIAFGKGQASTFASIQAQFRKLEGDIRRSQTLDQNLARFINVQSKLEEEFSDLKAKVLNGLIPLIIPVMEKLLVFIQNAEEWIENQPGIDQFLNRIESNQVRNAYDILEAFYNVEGYLRRQEQRQDNEGAIINYDILFAEEDRFFDQVQDVMGTDPRRGAGPLNRS